MKSTIFTMAALGAIAAASPASAQSSGGYGSQNGYYNNNSQSQNGYYNQGYDNRNGSYANGYGDMGLNTSAAIDARIGRLDQRLQAGVRSGSIDRREAMQLRSELRDLRSLSRRYSYNGLTGAQRSELAQRLRSIREEIRTADNGSWDRYDQDQWGSASAYGSTGGYGSNGAYGSANTRTYGNGAYANGYSGTYGNGYSGSATNGYSGSYNNGYNGQGGPYQQMDESCQSRGGIGGLIDNVFGRDNCTTGLRVGEQASGSLYGVPYELRNQYRDSYNYYYRSDGRTVYQIDARSNTVLRAYPISR